VRELLDLGFFAREEVFGGHCPDIDSVEHRADNCGMGALSKHMNMFYDHPYFSLQRVSFS
jgi:hypothetical protein